MTRTAVQMNPESISVPAGTFPAAEGVMLAPEALIALTSKLKEIPSAKVAGRRNWVTATGRPAVFGSSRGARFPPGAGSKLRSRNLRIEATPELVADGFKIAVKTEFVSIVEEADGAPPKIDKLESTQTIFLRDGEGIVITKEADAEEGREVLFLLRATTRLHPLPGPAGQPPPFPELTPASAAAAQLIVPDLQLRDATVAEAVASLRQKSVEIDLGKRGVEFILKLPPQSAALKLNISLTGYPVHVAARRIAELADLDLRTEADAFILAPTGVR